MIRTERVSGQCAPTSPTKPPSARNGLATGTGRLTGKARMELEQSILGNPATKGIDRAVLLALFGFFRGKAVCWPGNAALAKRTGFSPRTISNALRRLEAAGILKTVDDSTVWCRRQIVLLQHPSAAAELARLQASPHVRMNRNRIGARRVPDKCQRRLHEMQSQPCTPCNPEIARDAIKSVNRSSWEAETVAGTVEESLSLNGNGTTSQAALDTSPATASPATVDPLEVWRTFAPALTRRIEASKQATPARPAAEPVVNARPPVSPVPPAPPAMPKPLPAVSPVDEPALFQAMASITHGTSREEVQTIAWKITRLLNDGGSFRYWLGVLRDARQGIIPPGFVAASILGTCKDPAVDKPAAAASARIQKFREARKDRLRGRARP